MAEPQQSHPPFLFRPVSDTAEQADQIQAAYSYDGINDTGQKCHVSQQERDKIEFKETDQSPVYRSDDRYDQRSIIKWFGIH